MDLSGSAEPLDHPAADPEPEVPPYEGAGEQRCRRLERHVEPVVGGVGANRHDPDQGQLHPRRAAVRARLPADGSDLDGERLQRLHRLVPRVPEWRPLPQGAHGLGAAFERLSLVEARGDGRPSERRARAAHGARAGQGHRRRRAERPAGRQAGPDRGHEREGVRGVPPRRRRHCTRARAAARRAAVRGGVLQVERGVELHRQPPRGGAEPGRRACGPRTPARPARCR